MSAIDLLEATLGGAVAGLGLLCVVMFFVGVSPRDPGRPRFTDGLRRRLAQLTTRLGVAIVVAVVVLVATRWVVLAVAVGFLAGYWQLVFGGAAAEQRAIAYLDALAGWTESLRDTVAGAIGLEQAIPATAATAAASIQPALHLLVDRLRIREPLPRALEAFADDLDDASADLVIAALVLNARLRGPGLREVLSALATSAREELDMRRRVEAERRATRRSVRIVVGVTLGVAAMLIVLNHKYVAPYNSLIGQVFLAVVVLLFAGGVLWLRRLAAVEMPGRFLLRRQPGAAEQPLNELTMTAMGAQAMVSPTSAQLSGARR